MNDGNRFDNYTVEEVIATVFEYKELSEFLEDEQLDRALELLARVYASAGEIPAMKVQLLIVELQALATHCAVKAIYYQTIGKVGADASHKKNIYYSMKDALGKLSDSLKYMAK